MKDLGKFIILTLLLLTGHSAAQELATGDLSIRNQLVVPAANSAQVNRGPNQTQSVSYQKAGVGAGVNLQLADIVSISHSSHFGGMERHITSATLAPKSPVSVQALRIATDSDSVTRVGPSVKLGNNANIWYGFGTGGSSNLLMVNGNVRF